MSKAPPPPPLHPVGEDLEPAPPGPAAPYRLAYQAAVAALPLAAKPLGLYHDTSVDTLAAAVLWQRAMLAEGQAGARLHRLSDHGACTGPVSDPCDVGMGSHLFQIGELVVPASQPLFALLTPRQRQEEGIPLAEVDGEAERLLCLASWTWEVVTPRGHLQDWAWLAALGCVAKGLPKVSWLATALRRCTLKYTRRTAALCDVARRAPTTSEALPMALKALHEAAAPRDVLASPEANLLLALEEEFCAAWTTLKQTLTPHFCGRLMVIEIASPWFVEDLVVHYARQAWPGYPLLVGNRDAARGAVRYRMSAQGGLHALDYLLSMGWQGSQVTSQHRSQGHLSVDAWRQALGRLGVRELA